MNHFCKPVDDNVDGVITLTFLVSWDRQPGYKVHQEIFLSVDRYWQGLQITIRLMFDRFWGQTNVAAFNVDLKILFEARLVIFPADKLSGFIDTKVPYQ